MDSKIERESWVSVEKDGPPKKDIPVLIAYIGAEDHELHGDAVAVWRWNSWIWWDGSLLDSEDEVEVDVLYWRYLPDLP